MAKHFLGTEGVSYIGWDYGDAKIALPEEGPVYIIDLNPECLANMPGIDEAQRRIVWIDHHASAIDKWGTYLPGYRIDGVAACRLAYQWFHLHANWYPREQQPPYSLPVKQEFIDRKVVEPIAVRLAGEYDIWDHRGDGDIELQFGLRIEEPEPIWATLVHLEHGESYVQQLINRGKGAMAYSRHIDRGTVKNRSFLINWAGLKFLALNTARCNSLTFEALDVPATGHEALMAFYWDGRGFTFSLYHAAHRKDLDLSLIAKKFGGGGHKGACGFRAIQIPFPLIPS